jgi:hypothetical protein
MLTAHLELCFNLGFPDTTNIINITCKKQAIFQQAGIAGEDSPCERPTGSLNNWAFLIESPNSWIGELGSYSPT